MGELPPSQVSAGTPSALLAPFVPRLLFSWELTGPQPQHRAIEGSLAFVDISGFTQLTERLAVRGKAGAEEMSDLLDATFAELLTVAIEYDAHLVKWGGDALLLLFQGEQHAAAAARACHDMMQALEQVGRLQTSAGEVVLRMSAGIHSGRFDFALVGERHRELLITGPGATVTARMEGLADAGEIVFSAATAALLEPSACGPHKEEGTVLAAPPAAFRRPPQYDHDPGTLDITAFLPEAIRAFLLAHGGEGEHRRVTVAFVEFTGVDALLERDGPDAAKIALDHLVTVTQNAAAMHRVTFFETDIGPDGGKIMLVAGAPRSVGNNEERLLHVARAVVSDPGPLTVRVGVNAGRVFAGGFGPSFRRTYSVKGDAVNLAARVMGKAKPGEVLATEEVIRRSFGRFQTEPVPPFMVKGKAAPVEAQRVLTAVPIAGGNTAAASDATPLVGRDEEISLLLEGATSAETGNGAVVVVTGEPGIGKSRLVAELYARAPLKQVGVRCEEYESTTPYAAPRRLLRELLGIPLNADRGAAALVLTDRVLADAPSLEPVLGLLGPVVDADVAESLEVQVLDDQFKRARLEQATVEFLETLLSEPTILVVEDSHLADDSSAALLAAVCLRAPAQPWLVLVTRRDQPGGLVVPEDCYPVELRLEPLTAEAMGNFAEDVSDDQPLPEHVMASLIERSGGNPLFLRSLIEAAHMADAAALPDSIEGVIGAQIDRLPPSDRSLLRAAAVLGLRFDPTLLKEVLEKESQPPGFGAWRRLASFVAGEGASMQFRHALVRDTAYEGLSYRRRQRLHELVGEVIERRAGGVNEGNAELLALHFAKAEKFDSTWFYARIAGDRAVTRYANVEAAEFFEAALEAGRRHAVDTAELAAVAENLGRARFALAEFPAAADAYRAAWELIPEDRVGRARLAEQLSTIADYRGDLPQALHWLDRGEEAVGTSAQLDAVRAHAALVVRRAFLLHQKGDDAAAERCALEGVRLAQEAEARAPLAMAYTILDTLDMMKGRFGVPADEVPAQRALALWEELGDLPWQARVLNHLGGRAYFEGRWDDAVELYEASRATYLRIGDTFNAAMELGNIAEIVGDRGDPARAVDALRQVVRTSRAAGGALETPFWECMRARFLARAGEPLAALEELTRVTVELDRQGRSMFTFEAKARTAECLALLGLSAEAVELCTDLLRRADELPGSTTAVPLLKRVLGYGLAQQGRPAEAQSALLESLATAREQHALHEIAFTLGALMQLAHEQPDLHVEGVAEESAKLRDQLKMTALPQISVQLGERVQLPEQAATDVVIRAAREPRAPSTDVGVTRR